MSALTTCSPGTPASMTRDSPWYMESSSTSTTGQAISSV